MITEASLAAKLRRLGSTPDAIAKELERRGFKGRRGSSCFCPVAMFLRRTTQGARSASVGHCTTTVLFGKTDVSVNVPAAVADFVKRFDKGRYPFLEA